MATARLGWIEGCRGIAATTVLAYHVVRHFDKNFGLPLLKAVFQFGHAGVDLFFVVSGFIILFVHYDDIGSPARIKRYLGRRLIRILPVYWIAVMLTVGMILAGGHSIPIGRIAWAILPVPIFSAPIVGVAWTLQYEFVFYAMFALLILNRMVGIAAMLGWLIVIIANAVWAVPFEVPQAYFSLFNLEFFAGMAVAYRMRQGRLARYQTILIAGIVLFASCAIAEDFGAMNGYGSFARIAYGLACAALILGAAEVSRQSLGHVPLILQTLGSASYSLYLFQFVFIGVAWQLWLASGSGVIVSPVVGCGIITVVAVGGGIMVSRFVEFPLMRLIRDAIGWWGAREAAGFAGKKTSV
jgi:peptidoglycan/LPS O-acetylase OafA/YrhL